MGTQNARTAKASAVSIYEANGIFGENERLNNSVDAATMFFPAAKPVGGLAYLKKLNAAQFSKQFKGNLAGLKPTARGKANKFANYIIEKWNEYIPSGSIISEGAGSLKSNDEEENQKTKK